MDEWAGQGDLCALIVPPPRIAKPEGAMRHSQHRFTVAALALASFLLAGCTTHQRLATQAVSFNLTVERAQNEMLLLNVIRAKDRLPMYLSGISGLTGNVQTTLTSTLGGSYTDARTRKTGGGLTTAEITDALTHALTPSVGANFSKNPTFTLAVLDTQEFMRGFLAPVGKDTLNYYWTQGWPRELLLYLLVQRVEIEEEGKPLKILRNYPDSADPAVCQMERFSRWVQAQFLAWDPQIVSVPVPVNIGPRLEETAVTDLAKLVEIAKEGLQLEEIKGKKLYQLQKPQTDLRFRLAQDRPAAPLTLDPCPGETERQYEEPVDETGALRTDTMSVEMGTTKINFVLRSPEGLIYYLGQLARLENREPDPRTPYVCIQKQYQPLFVALPTGTCTDTFVDADTGRQSYSIPTTERANTAGGCEDGSLILEKPTCEGGRSMQALQLLSQLLSLHKSAKDNPATGLVRFID